jgi:hypothetical protein
MLTQMTRIYSHPEEGNVSDEKKLTVSAQVEVLVAQHAADPGLPSAIVVMPAQQREEM